MDHFGANGRSDNIEMHEIELHHIEIQPVDDDVSEPRRGFFRRKIDQFYSVINSVNDTVNKSTFGRVFRLKGSGHVSLALSWTKQDCVPRSVDCS